MRLTRYHLFLLGGLFLIILGPWAFTQPGPGSSGGRGPGRGDPSRRAEWMFNQLSGNQESFEVAKVQLPPWLTRMEPAEKQKERMLAFLVKKGVNDGKMTKALYTEYAQERMEEFRAQGGRGKGPPPPPASSSGGPAPAAADVKADPDAAAREAFKRFDTNGDGALSIDELQAAGKQGSRLFKQRDRWDTNKNGTIELPEFIEYNKNRKAGRNGSPATAPAADPVKPQEEDRLPTVYRFGKMPRELPAWFSQIDEDKDGQIGLYEWKESGRPVEEFLALDHNGDGFITVEEFLRDQKVKARKSAALAGGPPGTSPLPGPHPPLTPSPGQDGPPRERGRSRR